jgi:hypothetical protein
LFVLPVVPDFWFSCSIHLVLLLLSESRGLPRSHFVALVCTSSIFFKLHSGNASSSGASDWHSCSLHSSIFFNRRADHGTPVVSIALSYRIISIRCRPVQYVKRSSIDRYRSIQCDSKCLWYWVSCRMSTNVSLLGIDIPVLPTSSIFVRIMAYSGINRLLCSLLRYVVPQFNVFVSFNVASLCFSSRGTLRLSHSSISIVVYTGVYRFVVEPISSICC